MSKNQQQDLSAFPDPVYKQTVLAPLFEGVKTYFIQPVRLINQAHLVMLYEAGIIEQQTASALARALLDIDNTIDTDALEYTGEHEDYFFLVEAELKRRLGPDQAGKLHTARSRNDMDHTMFKMVLRTQAHSLLSQALTLANRILDKSRAERDTVIVAYTHGQPAQPTTLGHYLCAMLEVLLRDVKRLCEASDTLDLCPMGAAAITTSGFAINRERIAQLLGFTAPLLNSYGCIAAVDYITGWYSAVKLLFLHLGRVIQDLQFWSAFEVGQLYIPNSLVQISSIMPQKRNPVPIEHLRHMASVTCGRCDTIINTMHNTPFTDMNDSEGEVQQAGYAAFDSGLRTLELLTTLIQSVSVNQDRVNANSNAACITITELADSLVREESLSFRQAHEVAAQTAQQLVANQQPLEQGFSAFNKAFWAITNRRSVLTEKAFIYAVSTRHFINVRDRTGGPAPSAMDSAFEQYATQLETLSSKCLVAHQRQLVATQQLNAAFKQLAGV